MLLPKPAVGVLVAVALAILGLVSWLLWAMWTCARGPVVGFLYAVNRLYARCMSRWRANRPCPFPRDAAAIIIANHTSPLDPAMLWYRHNVGWPRGAVKIIHFLVAAEYYAAPGLVGWVCRTLQAIPVKRQGRDMKPVRQALARLEEGSWLGLFPEGRINKQPEEGLLPFDTGAAFFAFKSGAPVYPVFIHDAPRGETVFRAFFRRTRVRVTFGEPILLREMFAVEKPDLPTLQAAAEHLREVLTQLGEDCWFAPAADGGDVSGPSATDSANH